MRRKCSKKRMSLDSLFSGLPLELQHKVFTYFDGAELGSLALVNTQFRQRIFSYLQSPEARRLLIPFSHFKASDFAHLAESWPEDSAIFTQLGLLLKRLTCLFPTRERLRLFDHFVSRFVDVTKDECRMRYVAYGHVLRIFCAGWDRHECKKLHSMLALHNQFDVRLDFLLKKPVGTYPSSEMQCRWFYRHSILDAHLETADRVFWLDLLLSSLPIVHQAKLVLLLFCPCEPDSGEIHWRLMSEWTAVNRATSVGWFGPMTAALRCLYSSTFTTTRQWRLSEVVSIFEELIAFPDDWLVENVAELLAQCGLDITICVLQSRAMNGRVRDLSHLYSHLFAAYSKLNLNIDALVGSMYHVSGCLKSMQLSSQLVNLVSNQMFQMVAEHMALNLNENDHSNTWRYVLNAMKRLCGMVFARANGVRLEDCHATPVSPLRQNVIDEAAVPNMEISLDSAADFSEGEDDEDDGVFVP